jgi:hypothetical protein
MGQMPQWQMVVDNGRYEQWSLRVIKKQVKAVGSLACKLRVTPRPVRDIASSNRRKESNPLLE